MLCYICDFNITLPSGINAIVACPGCKRNILTDGSDSELISKLKAEIHFIKMDLQSKINANILLTEIVQNKDREIKQICEEFQQSISSDAIKEWKDNLRYTLADYDELQVKYDLLQEKYYRAYDKAPDFIESS